MTDHDTTDLFLFASGEMPPQQQDQFAGRIAHDPQLAAALHEIQSLTSRTNDYFTQGEHREHRALLEARRSSAVRQVSRAIVQRRLEDADRAASVPHRTFKVPRWMYAVAALAVLIAGIVALVQWGSNLQSQELARNDDIPFRSREFRNDVFPMVENDFDTLSLSASKYETSSMFRPDDDAAGSTGNGL